MNSAARRPANAGPQSTPAQAAAALADRRAAVLPVEGVLALAAAAETPAADLVARVRAAAGPSGPLVFHLAPDAEAAEKALSPLASGVHRRLVRRLAPGPAIFTLAAGGPRFSVMHSGRAIGFEGLMCTAEPATLAALARVEFPVVAAEIAGPDGGPAVSPDEAAAALAALGIDALPPPAAPLARAVATVIELLAPDAAELAGVPFRLRRAGGYEERFIRKQLALNVLFVCTGNTCRSPMAEAIASWLVQPSGRLGDAAAGSGGSGGAELRFGSAGTAASGAAPASPEAVRALRGLDIPGSLAGHRSRALTRRMIEEADAIYTMGRSHVQAVLELSPEAEGRVRTLDPDGGDVPDPIGMSQDVYTTTARRIMEMVRRRLKELQA